MSDMPQTASGRDLARQALAAYQAKAKEAGLHTSRNVPAPKRRARAGGGSREPVSFAAALSAISREQGWDTGLRGGSILDQWPQLCPAFEGRVSAEAYDDTTGTLSLRPASQAYAAQLRLLGGQLAKQINDKVGSPVVQRIRILPVAALVTARGAAADPCVPTTPHEPKRPVPPAERSPGYLAAVAAAREHRPKDGQFINPHLQAAIEASDRALADPRNREPEHLHAAAIAEAEHLASRLPADELDAAVRAARVRARREREVPLPRQLFVAS
ncbi:DciA family protein [Streptomyces xanthochromogenes]|uniref:DciA family protein n=1 Tax=Streptomyces xanthochromogenes TaxID=67384 RepID=UPI00344532E5